MAALADMLLVFVRRLRWIGVEDDPLEPGQRHEALAACAADQGEAGLARQLHAPGREARARDEHRDTHLHGLDDHLGGEPAGGVENLVVRRDAVEEHIAGDLVDGVVAADVLDVEQRPVLLARTQPWMAPALR